MSVQQIRELPLISVGMPVRNEAAFIESALDALLQQEDVNLELIISDNASTDATEAICRRYAALDSRIRYHRHDENVGASANFRFVLEKAQGAFFMWASGHDRWDSNYLKACSEALRSNPDAMIAFGTTHWIGADGAPFPRAWGWSDTRGLSLVARYSTVFWGNMNPIIGMIRRSELRQQRFDDMVGIDLAILLALALKGSFMHVWQTGWCRREFRKEVSYEEKLKRYRSADYALTTSWLSRHFPFVRLPLRIFGDLFASGIALRFRIMIFLILLTSMPVKYLVDKAAKAEK
jgi:glycosyltransferase involved in cell wall biosynthesis